MRMFLLSIMASRATKLRQRRGYKKGTMPSITSTKLNATNT